MRSVSVHHWLTAATQGPHRKGCTKRAPHGGGIKLLMVACALVLSAATSAGSAPSYASDDPFVGTWQNVENARWKLTITHPTGQPNKLEVKGAYPHCDEITLSGSDATEASTECTGTVKACKYTDHPSFKRAGDKLIFTFNVLSMEDDGTCRIAHTEQNTATFKLVGSPSAPAASK